jgi:hypothetical protein
VELTIAALFLVVLAGERVMPAGLGFTLDYVPRERLSPQDGPPFWCMYAMHAVFATTLVAVILIAADGFAAMASVFLPAIALGFVVPIIWPQTRMLPAADEPLAGWPAGLVDGVAGLAVGLLSGLWIRLCRGRGDDRWSTGALIALGCAVGVVLGWQPTPLWTGVIWIFALIMAAVLRRLSAQKNLPARLLLPEDGPEIATRLGNTGETPVPPGSTGETPVPPGSTGETPVPSGKTCETPVPAHNMPPEEVLPVPPTQEIDPP